MNSSCTLPHVASAAWSFASRFRLRPALGLLALVPLTMRAQAPIITTLAPTPNSVAAPRNTAVSATFNQGLNSNAATLGSLRVFSQQAGGRKAGTTTSSGNTLTFKPNAAFKAGETVSATLTTAAQSSGGTNLAQPRVFQFTTAAAAAPGTFGGGQEVAVGQDAQSVVVGDVDGDGDLDLLTANATGSVSVRLNDGQGTYSGGQAVATSGKPQRVVLGDIDNDGDLDFLSANATFSGAVSIRFNNGRGSFGGGQDLNLPGTSPGISDATPTSLALGDLDGDGDLDLVTANSNSFGTLSVRFNNGSGIFGGGTELTSFFGSTQVLLGDMDSDGDLDLITNSYPPTITILANNGAGSFSTLFSVKFDAYSQVYGIGDVNGDGALDLLLSATDGLQILLNNGSSTAFASSQTLTVANVATATLGDVDGDGDLDIVAATSTGLAQVLPNVGGRFSSGATVAVASNTRGITTGDVDGDGDLDLLTANGTSNSVSIRLNQVPTQPTLTRSTPAVAPAGTSIVLTGSNLAGIVGVRSGAIRVRFNGVEATDFVVNSPTQITVKVPAGATSGPITVTTDVGTSAGLPFTVGTPAAPSLTGVTPTTAPAGTSVVLTGTGFTSATSVRFNGSEASFVVNSATQLTAVVPSLPTTITGPLVVVGSGGTSNSLSFTVTGPPVVTTLSPARNAVAVPVATPVRVGFNQGLSSGAASLGSLGVFSQQAGGRKAGTTTASGNALTFTPSTAFKAGETVFASLTTAAQSSNGVGLATSQVFQFTTATAPSQGTFTGGSDVPVGAGTQKVVAADVNGDGNLDLLTANYTASTVSVRLGNGKGAFSSSGQEVAIAAQPYLVAAGDVDNDGDLDLLVSTRANTVSIHLNNGGTFGQGQEVAASGASGLVVGDLNGDGKLDFAGLGNTVSVRLGNGDGTFANGSDTALEQGAGSRWELTLGDIDNDGDLDLIAAYLNYRVRPFSVVLRNAGDGRFTLETPFSLGGLSSGQALADIDGDGTLDLIRANALSYSSAPITILRNKGDGLFTGGFQSVDAGLVAINLTTGDVDGDGDIDILAIANDVQVLLNNGSGTFTLGARLSGFANNYFTALGDVDNNGTLDLLATNTTSGLVYVRLNQPTATTTLRVPENPVGTVAGLEYAYYQADNLTRLPNFGALTAQRSGVASSLDVTSVAQRDYAYALKYTGYVTVPTDGQYTFYTASDDGSQLFIGSTLVVDNDDEHAEQERVGTIGLQAGTHALTVTYFQSGGGSTLNVGYQSPAGTRQLVPATSLRRLAPSATARLAQATTGPAPATATAGSMLQVFPNPGAGRFMVHYEAAQAQAATLELTDEVGRRVRSQAVQLQAGPNELVLDATGAASGLYQLRLRPALARPLGQRVTLTP